MTTWKKKTKQSRPASAGSNARSGGKAGEQLWGGVLHGDEKVQKATEFISEQAAKVGLAISPEEIRTLIEWAVRTLKDEFGEAWGKVAANTPS